MDRQKLADILNEMGTLMDLKGENPFKVRAHTNAARIIETFDGSLEEAICSGEIGEVKGIGPALKEKITEFYKTGKVTEHEKLKESFPAGVLELLRIPGLGPKKVKALLEKLNITDVTQLEYACRENRLLLLDGFGEKSQNNILRNIELFKKYKESFLYPDALFEAQLVLSHIKKCKEVISAEIAGSLRRKKEIIRDIDIVVASSKSDIVTKHFLKYGAIDSVIGTGDTKTSIKLKSGINCDLRIVKASEFPFALVYFTGSKDHNTALRGLAKAAGLKLNEYGLFKGEKSLPCKTEADVYAKLDMDFVAPELRENAGEIEAAQEKALPVLVEEKNLKGIFHCHTTESDGSNTLEEMVRAAEALGFEYIGISDHSKSSFYANGLDQKRLLTQFAEIDKLQKSVKIKILKGVEADILADGKLDYDNTFLKKFDFVIGSLHSGFSSNVEAMTDRVLKAFQSPYMDIFGHPTGRLLLGREPYALDMQKIIEGALKNNVIVELNANPHRLDIDWRHGRTLVKKKVMVSINPDAHSVAGLEDVSYGVGIARKAGLGPQQVLNTLPYKEMVKRLKRNRK